MGGFTNRNRHPEPGHAGQRNRDADLRCKASFDRLEQRPAFPNVAVRPRERQRNERHESDAADPVGDEHDMQMRGILHGNVYDWFVPVERGVYTLTESGRAALLRWPQPTPPTAVDRDPLRLSQDQERRAADARTC